MTTFAVAMTRVREKGFESCADNTPRNNNPMSYRRTQHPSPSSPSTLPGPSLPHPPTVIHVWSAPGGEKLYQFRRGTREAEIFDM
ncbi:hypothetical protein K443DRAFT_603203 [Laccaria amethystina LaAM-08-1]|uniref:Uncharacterized protein n=1 Tax=Laccaria amethystina LaAM-08-1 TaxID=1095629 RepID=A0A0C9WGP2_9AGAR|nr:hypothetical protein K443DRAFT_603203 [Laccaria amethystina LaAM-08-1]